MTVVPPSRFKVVTSTRWTSADLPSQAGRIFIVTGANSGIGLPTARALAEAGAHVVLAVRDVAKGEAAAESIPGDCEVRQLDLADLSLRPRFRGQMARRAQRVDQQRWGDENSREAYRGRLRAADRYQPPRPLRTHQSAASAHHRSSSDRRLRRTPWRLDLAGRPQLAKAEIQSAGPHTSSRSWPTCCSHSNCSAG